MIILRGCAFAHQSDNFDIGKPHDDQSIKILLNLRWNHYFGRKSNIDLISNMYFPYKKKYI